MVLGKFPVQGHPTIWISVGQGPTALAVGAGGGCLDIFTVIYPFSPLCPSLWETARYRLKYGLKGPSTQPTHQQCLQNSCSSIVVIVVFTVPMFYFQMPIQCMQKQSRCLTTTPTL